MTEGAGRPEPWTPAEVSAASADTCTGQAGQAAGSYSASAPKLWSPCFWASERILHSGVVVLHSGVVVFLPRFSWQP